MTPTKKQKERRNLPFKFNDGKSKSWFYLCDEVASFHQPTEEGQQNVHGLRINTLIKALKACGYIALLLLLPVVVEAKIEVGDGPPGNVLAEEIWADQKAKHKQVVIRYADFLVMLSKVEHKDKLLNQCTAERGILIKLNDENGTIKKLNLQQVEALVGEVEAHRKLGETQEQISKAVQAQLLQKMQELAQEKRVSRYKSEAFWIGVVAIGLWVMN